MARPIFTPVYEETEETIKARIIGRIPETWRKEPGDFIHDAVAAVPLEIKQGQINRDFILKNGFALYAEGEYLDMHLSQVGMARAQATKAVRSITLDADAGVVIPAGHTASTVILDGEGNPLEFEVVTAVTFATSGTLPVTIRAKVAGSEYNVAPGSTFILLPPIPGVRSITDGAAITAAVERESDEVAYERYAFKVQNPDTGGNKNDYVRWAQEVTGVGKALCLPIDNGPGTVTVVIVGSDFLPALSPVVAELQTYLDPASEGMGEGKAPAGHQVTVQAAIGTSVTIAADVTLIGGISLGTVTAAFTDAVQAYFRELVFTGLSVSYAKIGALLISQAGVANYTGLTVNGATADVALAQRNVPVLGTVTLT